MHEVFVKNYFQHETVITYIVHLYCFQRVVKNQQNFFKTISSRFCIGIAAMLRICPLISKIWSSSSPSQSFPLCKFN